MKHEELPLEPVAGMVGLMIIQCRTFNIMYILGLICTNKLIKNKNALYHNYFVSTTSSKPVIRFY